MTHIHRSALLPYSAEQLFDLVNDVASYPEYMEGCVAADIMKQSETEMEARLSLRKGALKYSFATRNNLQRPQRIIMELLEGPFENLHGEWFFSSLATHACKVSLDLKFQVSSAAAGKAAEKLFEAMAANLVSSLCQRAQTQLVN